MFLFIYFYYQRCKKRQRDAAWEKYENGEKLSKLESRQVSLQQLKIRTRNTEGLVKKVQEFAASADNQIQALYGDLGEKNIESAKHKIQIAKYFFKAADETYAKVQDGK